MFMIDILFPSFNNIFCSDPGAIAQPTWIPSNSWRNFDLSLSDSSTQQPVSFVENLNVYLFN